MDTEETTRAMLPELAAEVAQQLGDGFEYVRDDDSTNWLHEVRGPGGIRIGLGVDWRKKTHVHVMGWLPKEMHESGAYTSDLHAKMPDIYVAASRGASALVKEINRRLLPGVREVLEEAHKRVADANEGTRQRDEAAKDIASLLGKPYQAAKGPKDDVRFWLSHNGRGSTSVTVSSGAYVRIESTGGIENLRDVIAAFGQIDVDHR